MRSIWNGAISFGLVHIPVKLYSATRSQELHLHYLHERDSGRIKNEKRCTKCGQKVEADELVRGYEVEHGRYVTLTEEDFKKVDAISTHTLALETFVDPTAIAPVFFDKPYYIAPEEKSVRLYALLHEALKRTHKIAVAKLTFHEREHLVAIQPSGRALMLEVLYFADEIAPPKGLVLPKQNEQLDEEEVEMAEQLIGQMTDHFAPAKYRDAYRDGLVDLIEKKRDGVRIRMKPQPQHEATEQRELLAALKASIQKAEGKRKRALAA
jgi:DNA end-binding protein Ku